MIIRLSNRIQGLFRPSSVLQGHLNTSAILSVFCKFSDHGGGHKDSLKQFDDSRRQKLCQNDNFWGKFYEIALASLGAENLQNSANFGAKIAQK